MPSDCSFNDTESVLTETPINLTESEEAFLAEPSSSTMLQRAVIATRSASPPIMLAVIKPLQIHRKAKLRLQGVASEPASARTSLDSDGECDHDTPNTQGSAPASHGESSSKGSRGSLPSLQQTRVHPTSPPPRLFTVRKQPAPLPKPPAAGQRPLPLVLHSASKPPSAPAPRRSFDCIRPLPPIPPSAPAHPEKTRRVHSDRADPHITDNADSHPTPPSPSYSIPSSTSTSFPPTPPPPKVPVDIRITTCESSSPHMHMQPSHSKLAPLVIDFPPESAIGGSSTAKLGNNWLAPDEISIDSPLPPDIPVAPSPVTAKRKQMTKLTRFLGETITEEVIDECLPVREEHESWSLKNGRKQILKALITPNRYMDNSERGLDSMAPGCWLNTVMDENRLSTHWVYEKGGARHFQDDYNQVLEKLRAL